MRNIQEMKLLIFSDFKRLTNDNQISMVRIAINCMKDRTLSTMVHYRIRNHMASLKKPHRILRRILKCFLRPRQDIHIHEKAQIGPGFRIYHGSGVAIGSGTIAGKNLTLLHGVTLGNNIGSIRDDWECFPRLGDNVLIGCGATILGNVEIGDNAKISANALVLNDVPDNCIAMGAPARMIRSFTKPSLKADV